MSVKKVLIFNSFVYSTLVQFGFFGFNVDIQNYLLSPNSIWKQSEFIGGLLATLTINNIFLGPFVSSLIISLGLGYFLINLPKLFIGNNSKILSIASIHLLLLISWPIFIGTTNSLRQVIALGFIFFLLGLLLQKKKNFVLIIIISCLLWFSHRFGKFNLIFVYYSFLINYFFFQLKINSKLTYLLSIILTLLLSTMVLFMDNNLHGDNYITGFNLLIPLYIIFFFSMCFLFIVFHPNYNERLLSLIFINLTTSATVIFFGNSILYERINWLTFILSIFIFGSIFFYIVRTNISFNIICILILLSTLTLFVQLNDNKPLNELERLRLSFNNPIISFNNSIK